MFYAFVRTSTSGSGYGLEKERDKLFLPILAGTWFKDLLRLEFRCSGELLMVYSVFYLGLSQNAGSVFSSSVLNVCKFNDLLSWLSASTFCFALVKSFMNFYSFWLSGFLFYGIAEKMGLGALCLLLLLS